MNFPDGLVPMGWLVAGHVIYWPLLVYAAVRSPWRRLRDGESMHVLLGTTVAMMLLWTMKAGFSAGINLHLLGATLATLMFGWPLAVLSMSLVVLGTAINDSAGWQVFAINGLLLAVLPVSVSYGLFRLVDRRLPNHLFVYIFLSAFFGAAIAIGTVGIASTAVLGVAGVYAFDYLLDNYLRYYPLLMFPEAFLTGMLITVFVVYRPKWVTTFDDDRYLKNQ